MSIEEIFPNPTVKSVIFQIRFSNLFSIENKMGDFQLKIMDKFPHSNLLFRRQLLFADIGPGSKVEKIPNELDYEVSKKIWQFKSDKNFQLNVLSDSLDITSQPHITYNLGSEGKFRDIIAFVIDNFLDTVPIINFKRIGLRYIDECPLPKKDNKTFQNYYDSVLPIKRFNITNAEEMDFKTVFKKGIYYLRYIESLRKIKNKYKLVLDYDGFAKNIKSKDYLKITDKLHIIIQEEYVKTIKKPVYNFMKKKGE